MMRVIFCLNFLGVLLNWPQISAEETTLPQETKNYSTNVTTHSLQSDNETTSVTNQDDGIIPTQTGTVETATQTKDYTQETTSNKNREQKSAIDPANTGSNEEYEDDVIMDDSSNKSKTTSREDSERNITNNRRVDDEKAIDEPKQQSNYFSTLTSNLLMPVLKTQITLDRALSHANEGFKQIGTGTYEAAAGTFNFLREAASAVFKSG